MSIDQLSNNIAVSLVTPSIEILNSRYFWVQTTSEKPVKPFSGVTLTDANADATETVTITVGDGGDTGTLTGEGLSGSEGGVYTLEGSAAEVTSKLHNLVFTPVEGQPLTTTGTVFTVTAQNSEGDAPVSVEVTGVLNADPAVTIKGAVANQPTQSEAPINPFLGMNITDALPGKTETLTITLSDDAGGFGGTLDGGDSAIVATAQFHGGDGVYTLSGSASVVTAALQALIFTPSTSQAKSSTTTTFTLSDKNSKTASPVINDTTTVINIDINPFADLNFADDNRGSSEVPTTAITGDNTAHNSVGYAPVSVDVTGVSNIDPPVAPTITAPRQSLIATSDEGVTPFANVTLTDKNAGATELVTIEMTGEDGTLSGDRLRYIGNGTYALIGSAAEVESQLNNLTFTPNGKHPGAATFLLNATSNVDEQAVATSEQITVTVAIADPDMAMSVGDFNGDGKQDIAFTNYNENTVSILLGNGDGWFQDKVSYGTGHGPVAISVGDFNRDGKLDLVVVNALENTASILLGKGDGTFQPQTRYATGNLPFSASVADIDKDGTPDLIVANNSGDNTVSVLLGKGDGTFKSQVTYATGNGATGVAAGDFNNDGKLDIVVGNFGDNTLSVLLGKGDGTFRPQTTYATGNGPRGVAAGDFNNDGKLDIVVGNYGDNTLSVLLGQGDGTFQPQTTFETGKNPASISVADFNADGDLDIIVQNYGDNTVSVMTGNGDGTFQPQVTIPMDFPLGPVAISDVNGDGQPDIIVSNLQDKTTIDFFNTTYAVPTISGATAGQSTDSKTPIKPFAGVTITDDNEGASEKLTLTMSGGGGTLADHGLTNNGDGSYSLTGAAADVASLLQGLTFTPDGKHPGAVTTFSLTDNSIVDGKAVAKSAITAVSVTDTGPFIPTITPISGSNLSNLSTTSEGPIRPFLLQIDGPRNTDVHSVKIEVTGVGGKLSYEFGPLSYSEEGQYYWGKAKYGDFEWLVTHTTFIPKAGAPATQSETHFKITFFEDDNLQTPIATYDQVSVINIDPPVAPKITAPEISLTATSDVGVNPFADVTLADTNAGATEKLTITKSGGAGTLAGHGLTDNGDGTYTLTGAAADVAKLLHALTFTPDAKHPGDVTTFSLTDKSIIDGRPVSTSNEITVTVTDTDSQRHIPASDVNGDHHSDILLQNDSGACYVWQMGGGADGLTIEKYGFIGGDDGPGAKWQMKSTGDFDGDGKSDLLLQYADTGALYVWEMNGQTIKTGGFVGGYDGPGAKWQVKSTADFNGDGKSDILLQYADNGALYVWEMGDGADGLTIKAGGFVSGYDGPGAKWQVKGTGDFNGDGKSDILLQYADTGACYVWEMGDGADGLTIKAGGFVGGYDGPGAKWQVKGVGDFNGDGKSDILLQYADNGACYVWEMGDGTDGLSIKAGGFIGGYDGPGAKWQVKSTGDFDGDGKSDILLQYADTGACYVWEMGGGADGLTIKAGGFVGGYDGPGADWHATA